MPLALLVSEKRNNEQGCSEYFSPVRTCIRRKGVRVSKLYILLFFIFYALVVTVGRKSSAPVNTQSFEKISFEGIATRFGKDL